MRNRQDRDQFPRPSGGRPRQNMRSPRRKRRRRVLPTPPGAGEMLNIHDLKRAYERAIGHKTSNSTVYDLLGRHGWRKLMPRPFHSKPTCFGRGVPLRKHHAVPCVSATGSRPSCNRRNRTRRIPRATNGVRPTLPHPLRTKLARLSLPLVHLEKHNANSNHAYPDRRRTCHRPPCLDCIRGCGSLSWRRAGRHGRSTASRSGGCSSGSGGCASGCGGRASKSLASAGAEDGTCTAYPARAKVALAANTFRLLQVSLQVTYRQAHAGLPRRLFTERYSRLVCEFTNTE